MAKYLVVFLSVLLVSHAWAASTAARFRRSLLDRIKQEHGIDSDANNVVNVSSVTAPVIFSLIWNRQTLLSLSFYSSCFLGANIL